MKEVSLLELLMMEDEALFNTLLSFLTNYYKDVVYFRGEEVLESFLYAVGSPVMLVAHVDTVFDRPPREHEIKTRGGILTAEEVGLGADDRAGVYAILELVKRGHKPTILFTGGEEVGGLGAHSASIHLMPSHVAYIVELDRRGEKDAVFYGCANEEFRRFVLSFGFVEALGSFSDISILCPAWGVAGVNVSVGYYGAHTKEEMMFLPYLERAMKRLEKMLLAEAKFYEYQAPRRRYKKKRGFFVKGEKAGDVRVRRATLDDRNVIIELNAHQKSKYSTRFVEGQIREFPTLVAEFGDEVVAYLMIRPIDGRYFIYSLVVLPRHRGRGVGCTIYMKAIEECLDLGIETVFATVRESNVASLRMHEKLGLVPDRVIQEYYKDGEAGHRFIIDTARMLS